MLAALERGLRAESQESSDCRGRRELVGGGWNWYLECAAIENKIFFNVQEHVHLCRLYINFSTLNP